MKAPLIITLVKRKRIEIDAASPEDWKYVRRWAKNGWAPTEFDMGLSWHMDLSREIEPDIDGEDVLG